jgi:hypothetical protein
MDLNDLLDKPYHDATIAFKRAWMRHQYTKLGSKSAISRTHALGLVTVNRYLGRVRETNPGPNPEPEADVKPGARRPRR